MRRFLPSPPGVFLKSSSICWFLTIFFLFVLLVLCWLSVVLVSYLHAIIYLRMGSAGVWWVALHCMSLE